MEYTNEIISGAARLQEELLQHINQVRKKGSKVPSSDLQMEFLFIKIAELQIQMEEWKTK